MSKKDELLNNFRLAKLKHERWLSYAEAIYSGVEISEEHTPLSHTDCEFGKWLMENGQQIYHIKSAQKLSEDHKLLHSVYLKLYKTMHENVKANFFNRSKIEKKHKEELEKAMASLESISSILLHSIDLVIDEISSMPESKVDSIF